MIHCTVTNVSISNVGFVVFLSAEKHNKSLPIFVGVPEAQAIAIELNGVQPPRPMTHDLMKNMLDVLEARLERVEVHRLENATFYGRLVLMFEGHELQVDARPSDAIALALRHKAPILVAEAVFEEAGVALEGKDDEEDAPEAVPEQDPIQVLRNQLEHAIRAERYEDAARLRDELRHAERSN